MQNLIQNCSRIRYKSDLKNILCLHFLIIIEQQSTKISSGNYSLEIAIVRNIKIEFILAEHPPVLHNHVRALHAVDSFQELFDRDSKEQVQLLQEQGPWQV